MSLIDRNAVIRGKHQNSVAAANSFLPKSGGWRRKIYDYIARQGFDGATDQELQEYFGKSGDTIRPTRKTLQKDGFIIDSGRTRKNAAGNDCTIWVTTDNDGRLL